MFTIDTKITDLKIKERDLYKVFFSMNIHQVATPELSAEDAKSYVFFFREDGRYLAYIGLYILRTDRKLYYSYSSNPFSESQLPEVESEARSFAEDMGVMLDDLGLARMSDLEKDSWIDEQDIFSTKRPAAEQQDAGVDQPPPVEQSAPVVQPTSDAQPVSAPAAPPTPTENTVSVQPAPAPQPVPAVPSAPAEKISPVLQSPVLRPETAGQLMPESALAFEQSQVQAPIKSQELSQPQRKPAVVSRQSADDVMKQAEKAGIVREPKQPLKKDIISSVGVTSRDKEALARLLASF
jgi:hypothetical protein